ncbi:MAG: hypothetical protein GY811_09370 [Myxococcales bacterium]|nr:hypothetical protein [Myxococcales bacterium]
MELPQPPDNSHGKDMSAELHSCRVRISNLTPIGIAIAISAGCSSSPNQSANEPSTVASEPSATEFRLSEAMPPRVYSDSTGIVMLATDYGSASDHVWRIDYDG